VNCDVHETLAPNQDTETIRKCLSIFKVSTCENLKNNNELNVEVQDNQREVADMQFNSIHQEDNEIHYEMFNINVNSRDDQEEKINNNEEVTDEKSTNKENQILNEAKKVIKNKGENRVKKKNQEQNYERK